jgi:hypothetical protein
LSEGRYNLVNSLFDQMITFRIGELQAATAAIHEVEAALEAKPKHEAREMLSRARALVNAVPVTEEEANDPAFAAIFAKKRKKPTDEVPQRQAEVEQQWDSFARANYTKAEQLARQALSMID